MDRVIVIEIGGINVEGVFSGEDGSFKLSLPTNTEVTVTQEMFEEIIAFIENNG